MCVLIRQLGREIVEMTNERILGTCTKYHRVMVCVLPVLYLVVMSLSVSRWVFRVDDYQQFQYVGEMESFWSLFRADVFGLMRPVKNLLFFGFSRIAPFGLHWCHIVGIVIGAISFFPVLALCRRILGSETKGTMAAAIWLFAPTLVSSAIWLSCVNILVMTIFATSAIVLHDSAWDNGDCRQSRFLGSAFCLFVALFSYECSIATLPLIVLFDIFLRQGRASSKQAIRSYILYAGVVCIFLVLRRIDASVISTTGCFYGTNRIQRIVSSPYFVVSHFLWWFWPFGQFRIAGAYTWGMVPGITLAVCWILLLFVFGWCFLDIRKHSLLKSCVVFFLFGFAPTSNCLGFGNGPYGDYYMALSSVGLATGLVELLSKLFTQTGSWRRFILSTASILAFSRVAAFAVMIDWANTWGDETQLVLKNARCNPEFHSPKLLLALQLFDQKRFDEALDVCKEIESFVGPDSIHMSIVYTIRAISEIAKGDNPQMAFHWVDESRRVSSRLKFSEGTWHFWRGKIYEEELGDINSAEVEYEAALAATVPCMAAANQLALIKERNGEHQAALALWERTVRAWPFDETALWHLAMAYRKDGDIAKAECFEKQARRIGGQ